jgi:hypothetical protein
MKLLIILTIFVTLLGFPGSVVADPVEDSSPPTVEQNDGKTYFLTAIPNGSRRSVKLDPPAKRLVITSGSGDTAVRCGNRFQSYNCSPGKRLELKAENQPIQLIWAENGNAKQVRLRIDVLEEFDPTEDVALVRGLAGCELIRPASRLWESVFGGTAQNVVHCS